MPRKAENISGQVFGRLTVQYPTEKRDKKGSVMWHCTCSCGGSILVQGYRLVAHKVKSCGCLNKEMQAILPKRLTYIDGTCLEFLTRKQHSNNTTGYTGIYHRDNGKWRAAITFKGKTYNLGTFEDIEEAIQARESAKDRLHRAFLREHATLHT